MKLKELKALPGKVGESFEGRKTYFVAVLMIILSGLKVQGYLNEEQYQLVLTVLGALGLAALRQGIAGK